MELDASALTKPDDDATTMVLVSEEDTTAAPLDEVSQGLFGS